MLTLNYRDAKPIYLQIKDGLKKLIVSGALEAEEQMPSVRELAGMLAINANTIQRAYRELEAEGFLYSIAGKGTFVSDEAKEKQGRANELLAAFDETVGELLYMGIAGQALAGRIEALEKRRRENDTSGAFDKDI